MRRRDISLRAKIDKILANAMIDVRDMDRAWEVIMESPFLFRNLLPCSQRGLIRAASGNMKVQSFLLKSVFEVDAVNERLFRTLHPACREAFVIQKALDKISAA